MGLSLQTNYPTRLVGNSVEHEQIKVRAFHDHSAVFVDLNDNRLSWVDREELTRIAAKLYGRKPLPLRPRR
jgi:hypothetical protein